MKFGSPLRTSRISAQGLLAPANANKSGSGAGFPMSFCPTLLVPAQRRRVGQTAGANQ